MFVRGRVSAASWSLNRLSGCGRVFLQFPIVGTSPDMCVDFCDVVDLIDARTACSHGESLNNFGSEGKHKMKKPDTISAMHQSPMLAALNVTSSFVKKSTEL